MKNAFGRFIRILDMAKERLSVLDDMSIDTSQTEKQEIKE